VRRTTKAALTLAAMMSAVAALAVVAAGPAAATYRPPSIRIVCGGTGEGSVCVLPPGVTTAPNSYSEAIAVSKTGTAGATVTFALAAGSLPPGLTMPAQSGSGTVISGNPTKAGTFNFTVKATDGAAPFTWSVASGSLPPGLALTSPYATAGDNDSQLSGTPTTAGTYTFTLQLSDYDGQQATQQVSLTVDPPLQITPTTLPAGTVGVKYSLDLPAQGGAPPYSWSVVDTINELPPGLTLDTTAPDYNNVLTGTPTKAGTFSFPMQVSDSQDNTVSGTLTITIKP